MGRAQRTGRAADAFADAVGTRRGSGAPPRMADADILQALTGTPPTSHTQQFSDIAEGFVGTAFAYRPETMFILASHQADDDVDTVYLTAGKSDGLGDRAGEQAFVVFTVSYNDIGELEPSVWADVDDLDEAISHYEHATTQVMTNHATLDRRDVEHAVRQLSE